MPFGDRARLGILARLSREDPSVMTSAANESANHVSNLGRWIAKAREEQPGLADEQAEQRAVELRTEHYRRAQRLSVEARRAKADHQ